MSLPTPYYDEGGITIYCGDCRDVLPLLSGLAACVTDPPYELGFMGKRWDSSGIAYSLEVWRGVLAALSPGAHLLAFGGTRTHHRMVCAVEDAGFEIRDEMQWLYGSGFPKSLDIGKVIDKAAGVAFSSRPASGVGFMGPDGPRGYNVTKNQLTRKGESTAEAQQWDGWGTALKPACEPICVARKPLEGTVAANVLKHSTGGINVDGCRVGTETWTRKGGDGSTPYGSDRTWNTSKTPDIDRTSQGRWPANVLFTHAPGCVCAGTKRVKGGSGWSQSGSKESENLTMSGKNYTRPPKPDAFADADGLETVEAWDCVEGCPVKLLDQQSGEGASRFFYCPKADRSERGNDNTHPTVKPLDLMTYLCRLVTPPGGIILDPFAGSGTTLLAARRLGFRAIGIEMDEHNCEIAARRLAQGALLL